MESRKDSIEISTPAEDKFEGKVKVSKHYRRGLFDKNMYLNM